MPVLVTRSTALIGATVANASGFDGTGMSVAVLDTGVLKTHEFWQAKSLLKLAFRIITQMGLHSVHQAQIQPSMLPTM